MSMGIGGGPSSAGGVREEQPVEGAPGDAKADRADAQAAAAAPEAAPRGPKAALNAVTGYASRLERKLSGAAKAAVSERPRAPLADFASDLVAKLPSCMRKWLSTAPTVGEIGEDVGLGKPAVIRSPELGESSTFPAILEIRVDKTQHGPLEVGKKVHEKFFEGYPPFDFNVNFSCARPSLLGGKSDYADPRSHWNNVFFGRYQIDTPVGAPGEKDKWERPFGFVRPGSNEVNFDDIQRIGKADWGYFSNWMYGVPEKDLDAVFAGLKAEPPPRCTVLNPSVMINGQEYVECEIDGVKLPSAYVSAEDGKGLRNNDALFSPIWRRVFGKQGDSVNEDPALAGKKSFHATDMKVRFYMRQEKRTDPDHEGPVYSTVIYGGAVNKTWAGDSPERQAVNERFLEAQMRAVRETMPGPS